MPLARRVDNRVVIETRFVDRHLIRQLPGSRFDKRTETWSAPLSWATCVSLRVLFKTDLELDDELVVWAQRERSLWIDTSMRLREMVTPDPTWVTRPSDADLLPFQRVGIRFMAGAKQALLAEPMGSGKTVQTIRALQRLQENDAIVFPALVICPNGVMLGWEEELQRWWPGIDAVVVHGNITERRRSLAEPHDVYVTNYETLRQHSRLAGYGSIRLRRCVACDPALPVDAKHAAHLCEHCPKELNRIPWRTFVVDEAHRLKNPTAKQTRAAWAVAHQATNRFALTGTPIDRDPGDLWPIMHTLSPLEFPSREKYLDLFCQKGFNFWGGTEILGLRPDTRDAFFKLIDPRLRRLPKEVILPQLPPVTTSIRPVQMGTKQHKAYREMERYMAANLDGELLMAPNPLTKVGRLMQLAAACATVEYTEVTDQGSGEHRSVQLVELTEPSCKLDALEEIIDELAGEAVVVASASRKLAVLAVARLERRDVAVGLIAGGMDVYARKAVEHDYQAGKIQVLVCVIDAAGEGLNLTRGRTLVYLMRHWSNIKNVQMDNRVHRIGSEHHGHVQIIDVITKGTIEWRQREVLAGKAERLEEIVRDREMMLKLLGQ